MIDKREYMYFLMLLFRIVYIVCLRDENITRLGLAREDGVHAKFE